MNEINLNALNRFAGVDKPLGSISNQKSIGAKKEAEVDSVQLSNLPDLSALEKATEEGFAAQRASLAGTVNSEYYPPLDTIDRLAAMLAIDLKDHRTEPLV